MRSPATLPSAFDRALSAEIAASELIRMRVLAAALAVLLVGDELLLIFARDLVAEIAERPIPTWLPLQVIGPFLAYEVVALIALGWRLAHGRSFPTVARFANATIETSLPTVILWWLAAFALPSVALGAWPTLLYFLFIVASTLRLDFVLPAYTGAVAAAGYLLVTFGILPAEGASNPLNHLIKAGIMVAAGIVAGLVAVRLRAKFRSAADAAAERERITNLFGQHVSPAVVDRLLASPAELGGDR